MPRGKEDPTLIIRSRRLSQPWPMDRVFIDNLGVDCRIGITEDERRTKQRVLVDVSIFLDLSPSAATGKIEDTVDYREAKRQIMEFASAGEFLLLESLAEGISALVMNMHDVERVVVRVRKEKYSLEPSIGVEIERGGEPR